MFARERGAIGAGAAGGVGQVVARHPAVDRRAAILPWAAPTARPRLSPVEASAAYLRTSARRLEQRASPTDERWRCEQQTIVLTVPASFDEVARELTVEAAREAGLAQLTLLEEPLAAFYAWMATHAADVAGTLRRRRSCVLVCDVGGGTTDFSLIRVDDEASEPASSAIAIGDHLLLGGDNIDVALAALVERRMVEARPALRLGDDRAVGAAPTVQRGEGTDARRRPRREHVTVTMLGGGGRWSATRSPPS